MYDKQSWTGGTSPVVLVLLGAILVAVLVLIVLMAWPHGSMATRIDAPSPSLGDGQTSTREQLEAQGVHPGEPSRAFPDTSRILQTYKPGRKYRTVVRGTVDSRASAKDWGVVTDMNFHYVGEAEVLRTIESNDGTTITQVLEFTKARNMALFCKAEDVRIDVGPAGQMLLAGLDLVSGTPGTWSQLQGLSAKPLLEHIPGAQSWADRVLTDESTKVLKYVDTLQGKRVRIQYVNGRGVTEWTPLGCTLSGDEQALIASTAVISDAYILPNLQSKEGDEWTVQGGDFLPVLDPSLQACLTGSLKVRRGSNGGTPERQEARIILDQGSLELQQVTNKKARLGRWAPRGELTFSFADKIVTRATLGGQLHAEERSTDHILFEARFTLQPEYQIDYFCEVLP